MCSHDGEGSTFYGSLSIKGERDPCVEGVSLILCKDGRRAPSVPREYEPAGTAGIHEEEHGGERALNVESWSQVCCL